MTTILNASNGATSGLIATGDNSGVLQLQVNNGTPALTLNATQALGVGSSPSYGTSGQLLQSNGSSSAPSWVASPATNPAGSTGQVQYNNAGAFGAVSSGTSGQVLTSAGSGSVPTWSTPSAGAMTLVSTLNVSGQNTFSWTELTANRYLIVWNNIATVDNTTFRIRFGYGATPTYFTNNYNWGRWLLGGNTSLISATSSSNDSYIYLIDSNSMSFGGYAPVTGHTYITNFGIFNAAVGVDSKFWSANSSNWSNSIQILTGGSASTSAQTVNSIQISFGVNGSTGSISLYALS